MSYRMMMALGGRRVWEKASWIQMSSRKIIAGRRGWRQWSLRPVAALAMLTLVVAGCTFDPGRPSRTPTPGPSFSETCLADKPELRYWARDLIAVSLRLPTGQAPLSDGDIGASVEGQLNKVRGVVASKAQFEFTPPLTRIGQSGTAFFRLKGNNTSAGCDAQVATVVNAINTALTPKYSQPQSIAAVVALATTELHPIIAPVGQDHVAITGASPDWLFTGAPVSDGGDRGGGTGGGPPKLPSPSFSTSDAKDIAFPSTTQRDGSDAAVVVLDTGYKLQDQHVGPGACASTPTQQCAPESLPIAKSAQVGSALGSSALPPFAGLSDVLEESDMALETDTPADITANGAGAHGVAPLVPPYETVDGAGNPVKIVDHGLFISGLIHEAAPRAQIRIVRVLNDYGVGDLRSILMGLQTVANHPDQLHLDRSRSIIVNMSLSFGPPADCLVGIWDHWQEIQQAEDSALQAQGSNPRAWNGYKLSCASDTTPTTHLPYKGDPTLLLSGGGGAHAALSLPMSLAVSDLARSPRVIRAIMAATGNDSDGKQHLSADLPAAICGVVPVAARQFSGDGGLAAFSNTPYLTSAGSATHSCLTVTHGDDVAAPVVVSLNAQSGASAVAVGVSVCGLFLQDIPAAASATPASAPALSPSPSKLALWDGTSFATGFASGYVAREGVLTSGALLFVPDSQPCNRLTTP